VLRWGGKQNTPSFTTNLSPVCCNFTKIAVLTILERCVRKLTNFGHGVYYNKLPFNHENSIKTHKQNYTDKHKLYTGLKINTAAERARNKCWRRKLVYRVEDKLQQSRRISLDIIHWHIDDMHKLQLTALIKRWLAPLVQTHDHSPVRSTKHMTITTISRQADVSTIVKTTYRDLARYE